METILGIVIIVTIVVINWLVSKPEDDKITKNTISKKK